MSLVEKEITLKNVERARQNPELEKLNEIEQKFTPVNPERFEQLFKAEALPIEQIYLSTPHDEFSLRVRCAYEAEGPRYTATQKSRGEIVGNALVRNEVETDISAEAYERYQAMGLPAARKLRAQILEGATVDFYDDATHPVVVEIEHDDPELREYLAKVVQEMTGSQLEDHSNDIALTSEAIAHRTANKEYAQPPESLDHFTDRVFAEMIAHYVTGKNQVVVGLTGMSGSGKSTVTRALQERATELYGDTMKPIVVSTDDYHFGKTYLEEHYGAPYTEWDAGKTYNTAELAADIQRLAEGAPLIKRHFDFETEEPVQEDELLSPAPFVIVEGLYAGSKDLEPVRDLHFALPTGIATSIGRDVRRLVIDNRANRAFPTPQSRLRHQIEVALPTYLEQEQPERKAFSASTRAMVERAYMLSRLEQ